MTLNWKKLEESEYKAGHRKLLKRVYELPDGKITDFDLINGGRVVCILALTKNRKVVLAKQFRPGPEKVLLELPGGGVEECETPEQAAKRELLEETGYTGELQFVTTSYQSAYNTLVRYNFVALNCEHIRSIQNDEHEHTEAVEMDLNDFRKHLQSGELTDIATGYLCLDHLNLL